jgi:hypothetical protein
MLCNLVALLALGVVATLNPLSLSSQGMGENRSLLSLTCVDESFHNSFHASSNPPPPLAAKAETPPVADEKLRLELLQMFKLDQEARFKLIALLQKQSVDLKAEKEQPQLPEVRAITELDAKHTARLKEIIDRHGWPGQRLVGKDGANAAWLLVQHADRDRAFQKRCLTLIEKAVPHGDAEKSHLAYLTDRVLVGEGKKQRYGTQLHQTKDDLIPQPIENPAQVDQQRAAMGLPSLAEYLQQAKEMYLKHKDEKK